jgi:hypothetical protein
MCKICTYLKVICKKCTLLVLINDQCFKDFLTALDKHLVTEEFSITAKNKK